MSFIVIDKNHLPAAELEERAHPGWLIDGVLPRTGLAVLNGAPGSGRTFIALDLAMAIARGTTWGGCKVNQGRVLCIAAEGAGGFRKRTEAYLLDNDIEDVPNLGIIAPRPAFAAQPAG